MTVIEDVDHLGIADRSDADISIAIESPPTQAPLSQEESHGCEVQSIIPSGTPCESKRNDTAEGIDKVNDSADARKPGHIDNDVLRSPSCLPKALGESNQTGFESKEEMPFEDVHSGGQGEGAVLTDDQDPAKEDPRNDIAIQSTSANPLPALDMDINDKKETCIVDETEVHQQNQSKATEEVVETTEAIISVPLHKRPGFQSPSSRQAGLQSSQHIMQPNEATQFNETPRGLRHCYPQYEHRRDVVDREYLARLHAQLMKTKNELDTERHQNFHLRKMIETEQQQKVDAACQSMLNNLLRDQTEALALKANVEARERNLDLREKKIQQYEIFLSEGQKQLLYKLGERGDRPMSAVQQEHTRRRAELDVRKSLADIEAKCAVKIEDLRLRAAAQEMREQRYKSRVRESLQAEISESALSAEKADEIAEIGYNNGFADGKDVACKEAFDDAQKRGFLEGYRACHRAQVTLSNFHKGCIPHDSPELDFIFNPAHPHNLFGIGVQIGKFEKQAAAAIAITGPSETEGKKAMTNGKANDNSAEERGANGKGINGASNGAVNGITNGTGNGKINGTIHIAHPAPKFPPSHPSLASQLRGHLPPTHNGYVVLANSPPNSAPPQDTGRPAVQKEGKAVVNLIDLL